MVTVAGYSGLGFSPRLRRYGCSVLSQTSHCGGVGTGHGGHRSSSFRFAVAVVRLEQSGRSAVLHARGIIADCTPGIPPRVHSILPNPLIQMGRGTAHGLPLFRYGSEAASRHCLRVGFEPHPWPSL